MISHGQYITCYLAAIAKNKITVWSSIPTAGCWDKRYNVLLITFILNRTRNCIAVKCRPNVQKSHPWVSAPIGFTTIHSPQSWDILMEKDVLGPHLALLSFGGLPMSAHIPRALTCWQGAGVSPCASQRSTLPGTATNMEPTLGDFHLI